MVAMVSIGISKVLWIIGPTALILFYKLAPAVLGVLYAALRSWSHT